MRCAVVLLAGIALLVAACDLGGTDEPIDIGGAWQGSATVNTDTSSLRFDFSCNLEQEGTQLTGTATLAVRGPIGAPQYSANVSGEVNGSEVSLEMEDPDAPERVLFSFDGRAIEAAGRLEGEATFRSPEEEDAVYEFPLALSQAGIF